MTRPQTDKPKRVTIETTDDGHHVAAYPLYVFRFLLSDGSTHDVTAPRDDSDLRQEVRHRFAENDDVKIEGVARLPVPDGDGR